jgi:enediyne biosynthesis protein E4
MSRRHWVVGASSVMLALLHVCACAASARFTDVTAQAGIDFIHDIGRSGKGYILETVASGCGFLDYDGDGLLDIYLVNGHALPPSAPNESANALYRNNGDGTFTDVTALAGVGDTGYGVGCATADYDGDGDTDLYVTNFERNALYRNDGDGTFTDVAAAAGVDGRAWSSSSAFLDYNGDGHLDLYVANYVAFRIEDYTPCGGRLGTDCGPGDYAGAADVLYRNNGDGTFADVTREAGVYTEEGKGLGVAVGDYDDDGDPDIYVANDDTRNFLYRNTGDGTFDDATFWAGVGFSEYGEPEGGMGAAFGDYDNDGRLDLVVTNYQDQVNSLYRNEGDGLFSDVSHTAGTALLTYPLVGWGTAFLDVDNDADLDLFVANGHLLLNVAGRDSTSAYAQPNLLYVNDGTGAFAERGRESGLDANLSSRGAAFGDYDNDGDTDILVVNTGEAPTLLRNDGGAERDWLGVVLVGQGANRAGVGARVTVTAEVTQTREVTTAVGYASASDGRLLFGLGNSGSRPAVSVRWPSGVTTVLKDVATRRYISVGE